jgi:cytochrome c peroxidase
LGNPIKRTCATCHNARLTGMDFAPGWMDLGTANRPWSDDLPMTSELPLFKLTCRASKRPHPYLGRVIYTHDPGRALISGRCLDIGAIIMQQFRGLAARAPYFSNGSAATLRELVDYYNKRFESNYTEQEKQDLINFLGVL